MKNIRFEMNAPSIVPLFAPDFSEFNRRAIDYGGCGFVAYASGCAINIAYIAENKFHRVCPIALRSSHVTCLKFHPTERILAVGDSKGQIFLYSIDERKEIMVVKHPKGQIPCLDMAWKDNLLLVLVEKHLIGLNHDKVVWEIELKDKFSHFSIDPHLGNFIMFSGNSPVFAIYKAEGANKPTQYLERIELTTSEEICDAQWSLHLPGYVVIVLKNEVDFFHIEGVNIVTIIGQRQTSSTFDFLLQLPSDYSKFLVFLKNGGIALFKASNSGANFEMAGDFQPKCSKGSIVCACASPFDDNTVVLYDSALGLGLLDLKTTRIVSADLTFPSTISSFDCDGTNYCVGTQDGYVISGNIFDTTGVRRFQVSKEKVEFVSFDAGLSRIHWNTEHELGDILLGSCSVKKFNTRNSGSMKCFATRQGALIVQRDTRALGVFIETKEYPLLTKCDIADVAIDESESRPSCGTFCVLFRNQEICFYKYSVKDGVTIDGAKMKPKGNLPEPLCFAVSPTKMATGFASGLIILFDRENKESRRYETGMSNLRKLKLSPAGLFGLGKEATLFRIGNEFSTCQYPVDDYTIVDDVNIIVKCRDNSVRFVDLQDWMFIDRVTTYLPLPSKDQQLAAFIRKRQSPFFEQPARDAWLCLLDKNNLRLHARTGSGERGFYERVNCDLIERMNGQSSKYHRLRFASLLFAGRFVDAAELIMGSDPKSPDFVESALFSAILYQVDQGLNEKAIATIKSAGIALFESGKYELGSLLFRIGKMDKIAVNYLLDYGQDELAMRFMRSCLDEEDKKRFVFRFGANKLEQGRDLQAIPFFACAGEFHPVLSILVDHGMICDACFLLHYLREHNLLTEISTVNSPYLPCEQNLPPLDDLCATIKDQFEALCTRLSIPPSEIKWQ